MNISQSDPGASNTGTPTEPLARRGAPARRRIWIVIAIVAGGLVVANLVAQGLDRAVGGDQPGGAAGSSYGTAPGGLAAFASLLSRYGHDVAQQRGSIADHPPAPGTTAFVVEPSVLTTNDVEALLQFVTGGGRLVVGGQSPFYLHDLSDAPPEWQAFGETSWTAIDPTLAGLRDIQAAGIGAWSAPGHGTPLVRAADTSLLTRDRVGRGEILYLADASPLENAYLASGDNAAFALALAGPTGRPVVFPEGAHGYGTSRGLAAIPSHWKGALLLIGVAALAFVWSRARRFGPPDRTARDLPPARATYVDALSVSLERTRDHARALASAQRWARTRLATRTGLGGPGNDTPNAAPDEAALERAARAFGCHDDEITALFAPVTDNASILALGRAIARVSGGEGRMQ